MPVVAPEDRFVGDRLHPFQRLGDAGINQFLELRLAHRDALFLPWRLPEGDLPRQPDPAHNRRTEDHSYDGSLHSFFPPLMMVVCSAGRSPQFA